MDLDGMKSGSKDPSWVRLGMLVCFGVAAAILFVSLGQMPVVKADEPHSSHVRPVL
jgi:hypothetical protein